MLRRTLLFLIAFIGTAILLVGCAGHSLYWGRDRTIVVSSELSIRSGFWEYRPEDWPLKKPRCYIAITLRSVAFEWVSLEPQRPKASKENFFYTWLDVSGTSREGAAFRSRILRIRAPVVPAVALAFLAFPAAAFLRGPCRRVWRKRRGCCPQCGYNLTGNVSGACPKCGEKI